VKRLKRGYQKAGRPNIFDDLLHIPLELKEENKDGQFEMFDTFNMIDENTSFKK
jgi:hypothetical protein